MPSRVFLPAVSTSCHMFETHRDERPECLDSGSGHVPVRSVERAVCIDFVVARQSLVVFAAFVESVLSCRMSDTCRDGALCSKRKARTGESKRVKVDNLSQNHTYKRRQ
jgi:hypothetical protein